MSVIIIIQSLDDSLLTESGVPFLNEWAVYLELTVVFLMTMIWGLVSFLATKDHSSNKYW